MEQQKKLDLKAIFDVPDVTGDDSLDTALDSAPEFADARMPDGDSSDLPDQAGPLVEPFADTKHVARPRWSKREDGSDWPTDAADFVLLLTPDDFPPTPFEFGGPHCVVTDKHKFLRWLKADVRRGPTGPRSMYGAIQGDMRRLRNLLIDDKPSS